MGGLRLTMCSDHGLRTITAMAMDESVLYPPAREESADFRLSGEVGANVSHALIDRGRTGFTRAEAETPPPQMYVEA